MRIPLPVRLEIVEALRTTPFPWRELFHEHEQKHSLTHSQVTSLAWSVMRCGYDDPYITGLKPADELRAMYGVYNP